MNYKIIFSLALLLSIITYGKVNETCINIPFNRLKVFKEDDLFHLAIDKLYNRKQIIKSFSKEEDAKYALRVITIKKYQRLCKIGEGQSSMEYWTE